MWPWSLEHRLQRLEERDDARTDAMKSISADMGLLRSQMSSLSQDTKTAPAAQLLERLESLERRFASFHEMMTEKSPATGAERLSKAGKAFKRLFR